MTWWNPLTWFRKEKRCLRCGEHNPHTLSSICLSCADGLAPQVVDISKEARDEERALRRLEAQQYKDRMREANRDKAG